MVKKDPLVSQQFLPGDLVVALGGTLARAVGTEEEHYTIRMQSALVIQKSHAWTESEGFGFRPSLNVVYLVLFSNDSRMYYVSAENLEKPDQAGELAYLWRRYQG